MEERRRFEEAGRSAIEGTTGPKTPPHAPIAELNAPQHAAPVRLFQVTTEFRLSPTGSSRWSGPELRHGGAMMRAGGGGKWMIASVPVGVSTTENRYYSNTTTLQHHGSQLPTTVPLVGDS